MEPFKRHSAEFSADRAIGGPRTSYAFSVTGGAGGRGTKISTADYGARVGSGFRRWYDHNTPIVSPGVMNITNEKITMQHLNDRLASYLETVRNLEKANSKLEIKIRECIEARGPMEGRDFSKYNATIADLRAKVSQGIMGSVNMNDN